MNISIRKIANGFIITATPPYTGNDDYYATSQQTKEYYAPDAQAVAAITTEVLNAIDTETV